MWAVSSWQSGSRLLPYIYCTCTSAQIHVSVPRVLFVDHSWLSMPRLSGSSQPLLSPVDIMSLVDDDWSCGIRRAWRQSLIIFKLFVSGLVALSSSSEVSSRHSVPEVWPLVFHRYLPKCPFVSLLLTRIRHRFYNFHLASHRSLSLELACRFPWCLSGRLLLLHQGCRLNRFQSFLFLVRLASPSLHVWPFTMFCLPPRSFWVAGFHPLICLESVTPYHREFRPWLARLFRISSWVPDFCQSRESPVSAIVSGTFVEFALLFKDPSEVEDPSFSVWDNHVIVPNYLSLLECWSVFQLLPAVSVPPFVWSTRLLCCAPPVGGPCSSG